MTAAAAEAELRRRTEAAAAAARTAADAAAAAGETGRAAVPTGGEVHEMTTVGWSLAPGRPAGYVGCWPPHDARCHTPAFNMKADGTPFTAAGAGTPPAGTAAAAGSTAAGTAAGAATPAAGTTAAAAVKRSSEIKLDENGNPEED